eukprot:CAMPEP_0202690756 /NCGR_PEP_ID=MMETSP1385-20130828/5652_1 /ASSEMBLY_ACC=CAM_ASM_000861 /TAXON_ID=933848 /ORGANISM="Elphidium margaritaceum" /LENGTH=164 /DNA_ID=CAMNT_0049346049 /DNA_START=280 /DNA_END=774 /DNA_ORIENTATION=-
MTFDESSISLSRLEKIQSTGAYLIIDGTLQLYREAFEEALINTARTIAIEQDSDLDAQVSTYADTGSYVANYYINMTEYTYDAQCVFQAKRSLVGDLVTVLQTDVFADDLDNDFQVEFFGGNVTGFSLIVDKDSLVSESASSRRYGYIAVFIALVVACFSLVSV